MYGAAPKAKPLRPKPLDHLRERLLTGGYVAVQDHAGRTVVGTLAEAIERMMAVGDRALRG